VPVVRFSEVSGCGNLHSVVDGVVDEWRDDPTQLKAKVAAFSKLNFPALRDDPDAYARWSFLGMAELDAWQEQNLLLLEPASDDVGVFFHNWKFIQ
jgi:hypothetical protein